MNIPPEIIRSRQNRNVVEVGKLSDRKTRDARQLFRFDGIKLLQEALKKNVEIDAIYLKASAAERIMTDLNAQCGEGVMNTPDRIFLLSDEVFDKISEEKSPEGVITVAKYIDKFQKFATIYNSGDFLNMRGEQIVLLESVRDPSNIGAIIRSAAAIGVDRLILSDDCADIYHPKAVRASMGAIFNQRIDRVGDLPGVIEGLQHSGRRVFAATLSESAVSLGDFPLCAGDCVVIGNEGHGLSKRTVNACDRAVIIPMTARAESFNAAVAASILMWEFSKAR